MDITFDADPGSLMDLEAENQENQHENDSQDDLNIQEDFDEGESDGKEWGHRAESPRPPHDAVWVPLVESLKRVQDFIHALQDASLDNGDLEEEALFWLSTQNSSQETYVKICQSHNKRYPEEPMLSYHQIKRKVVDWSGVEAIVHDMCPDSCVAYTGPFSNLKECPQCGLGRYDPIVLENSNGRIKIPAQQFYTIPVGPQLQALYRSPESAHDMGHQRWHMYEMFNALDEDGHISITSYEDIYQGSEYLEACAQGEIQPRDIVLMFGIDGAQLYRDKKLDCWIYIWIVLELSEELHYKKKHVLPGGFIPRLNNPKEVELFLFLGFHHVSALQKEGLNIWDALEKTVFESFIFYYLGAADRLVGHKGYHPCCLFRGLTGHRKCKNPRYYPALLRPDKYAVEGCAHPNVSRDLNYILHSCNNTDYKQRRKQTGILLLCLVSGLMKEHQLSTTGMLAGGVLHVCTLNLGDLLLPLWQGKFVCDPADTVKNWDWAVLTGNVWKNHSQAIHSGYKAWEWQGYLFGMAPALLHGILPHVYWKNFCKLVHAIWLLLQRSISILQLHVSQQCLDKFHIEFELLYMQCHMDCLHFVRPCIHALLHLGLEVPQLGPPCNLGEEIRQPSNPFANLSQRGVQHRQINALKALIPGLEDSEDSSVPRRLIDLGGVKVARWACVWFPTGQVARSAWKESQKPLMKLCQVMINEQVQFAEVQYYFLAKIRGENQGLALISLYSWPDAQLFEDSNWTVYSITALEYNEGLRVVDIKSIQAMVSVQPHSHHVEEGDERFFVWEQLGLDFALLRGAEEDVLDEIWILCLL
ncbi:hypothetical protein K439DRAFT_1647178 [Ramaria rubella]|nr:hypothetical protein K439DRAFT_1647178 [Ramaria rubella]